MKTSVEGYGYSKTVGYSYAEAVDRAREALQAEGFGVLCEINIREKLKEKLGIDFPPYLILGACNPPIAHAALQMEMNIGLLLPCNVVVYEKDGKTVVAAVDAAKLMAVVNNPALAENAEMINEKLRRVIDAL